VPHPQDAYLLLVNQPDQVSGDSNSLDSVFIACFFATCASEVPNFQCESEAGGKERLDFSCRRELLYLSKQTGRERAS
jgi:hypothetical protein